MRLRRHAAGLLCLLCLLAIPLAAADSDTPAKPKTPISESPGVAAALQVFDSWVDWTARNREQPGVSVGIVYDQEVVFAKGYGFADLARKIPATPETAYRIASISKTFTAHAILQLRDAGKLTLDDPITKWVPELRLANVDPARPVITVRHLLTHTSGIPREVDGTYWNDMNFPSRAAMLPVLSRMGVALPSETEWKYSNVAVSLAGYVVEAASGEPYADYISKHVLAPLGMTGTRVIPPTDMASLVVPYGRRVAGKPRRIEPFFNGAYMTPASNLASTVDDLAKYLQLQFRTAATAAAGGAQIVKGPDPRRDASRAVAAAGLEERVGSRLGHRARGLADADRTRRVGARQPDPGLVHGGGEVRRHRVDELGGRPTRSLRQPGLCDRGARDREGGADRRGGEDSRRRTRRGRNTRACTRGRTRRSTSPCSTGS